MVSSVFNKKNFAFVKFVMSLALTVILLGAAVAYILSPAPPPKWQVVLAVVALAMQCLMLPDYTRGYFDIRRQEIEDQVGQ